MWLEKYKSNGAVINKIKMFKTFNCLGLIILALGYLPYFFSMDSQNLKLMKYLQYFILNFVDYRHFNVDTFT